MKHADGILNVCCGLSLSMVCTSKKKYLISICDKLIASVLLSKPGESFSAKTEQSAGELNAKTVKNISGIEATLFVCPLVPLYSRFLLQQRRGSLVSQQVLSLL